MSENECFPNRTERESLINKIYSMVSPFFRWWVQYRKPLVVVNGFFPFKKAILIFLRSFGKVLIIPDKMLLERLPSLQKNEPLRNLLKVTEKDQYDFVASVKEHVTQNIGEAAEVNIDIERVHFFDPDTGMRLRSEGAA